jgi:hypothetical protein
MVGSRQASARSTRKDLRRPEQKVRDARLEPGAGDHHLAPGVVAIIPPLPRPPPACPSADIRSPNALDIAAFPC